MRLNSFKLRVFLPFDEWGRWGLQLGWAYVPLDGATGERPGRPRQGGRVRWGSVGFCVGGEGRAGQVARAREGIARRSRTGAENRRAGQGRPTAERALVG